AQHHLVRMLDAAEARGEIRGEIVLVPAANPIGLAQYLNFDHVGRYELGGGGNFNRNWPDLSADIAERVGNVLGDDERENVRLIRQAMRATLDERVARREVDSLFLALAREAFDADLVLDLHCDDEGLMHLFVQPEFWPELSDLAAELGCRAVFSEGPTGGSTFSEACGTPWLTLAARFPDRPIPRACLAATVELRGFIDVSDAVARGDAAALINVLRRRGYLAGEAAALPEPLCDATGFDACDIVRAPSYGVLVYHVELGDRVTRGQPIADVVDPAAPDPDRGRATVRAATDGVVITRRLRKLIAANQVLAKIAGAEPLTYRQGYLLED
ncbi:MAG TPA: succinylglutamate desuccinylase/aspartoacylase family protein, partial [Alphaproteobacteria bacterium]|nr:succinylglutamate desuccinylase/aspartoacylase family protein [Alphaproteobacteria bacterium]